MTIMLQLAVILLCLGCNLLQAKELHVCVLNWVEVDPVTLRAFEAEFSSLLADRGVLLDGTACARQDRENVIRISIFRMPPKEERGALGLAYMSRSRVMPVLEIYLTRLLYYLGDCRTPNVVGRALARIAAHEVGHYLLQDSGHSNGLMRRQFPKWR